MNRRGSKVKYYLMAWGEEKSTYGWQEDPRVTLSKQNILNRYRDYLRDIDDEVDPPRYSSIEDLLTKPLVPRGQRNRRANVKRKEPITDWVAQVWQPLQAWLDAMPGETA